MSNPFEFSDWDDDDEDSSESSSGPAGLRKALKDAQKQLKQAQQQLAEQGKTIRKRTIADALAAKGLNPKLAALVPADLEPTEEAVTTWVEEFSDVFAPASVNTPPEAGPSEPEGQAANQSFYTEEELAAQGIINRADTGNSAPTGAATLEAKLQGAESMEELLKIAQGG